MAAAGRRRARAAALQALYEADTSSHEPLDALKRIASAERLSADGKAFAQNLIEGVLSQQDEIDAIIARAAPAFPVPQLAAVDRNVLRLAIREMLGDNGTPVQVVINEAVELAKRYGSDSSARFINGVLGTVQRERSQELMDQSPAGRG
jgi:N utilization substance protein B